MRNKYSGAKFVSQTTLLVLVTALETTVCCLIEVVNMPTPVWQFKNKIAMESKKPQRRFLTPRKADYLQFKNVLLNGRNVERLVTGRLA